MGWSVLGSLKKHLYHEFFTVIDMVNNQGFEKVVMGTRGLSTLSGMLLGSVSSKVLHNVNVPVTLIH